MAWSNVRCTAYLMAALAIGSVAIDIDSLYVAGSEGKSCPMLRPFNSTKLSDQSPCAVSGGTDEDLCGNFTASILSDVCSISQKLTANSPALNATTAAFTSTQYPSLRTSAITSVCATESLSLITLSDGSLWGSGSIEWLKGDSINLNCTMQCADDTCTQSSTPLGNNRSGYFQVSLENASATKVRCVTSVAIVLLSNGSVMALGSDSTGMLGLPTTKSAAMIALNITTAVDVDILFEAIFVVLRNGTVLIRNNKTAAAIFGDAIPSTLVANRGFYYGSTPTMGFRILSSSLQHPIRSIATSSSYVLLLSADNRTLYGLGANTQGVIGSDFPSIKSDMTVIWESTESIASFAAGVQHAMLQLGNGSVFGKGSNSYGQLYTTGDTGAKNWVQLDAAFHLHPDLSSAKCRTTGISAGNGNSFAILDCFNSILVANSTLVSLGSNIACSAGAPKSESEIRSPARVGAGSIAGIGTMFAAVYPTPNRQLFVITRQHFDIRATTTTSATSTSTTTTTIPTTTATPTATPTSTTTTTSTTMTSTTSAPPSTATVPAPTLPSVTLITAASLTVDRARLIITYKQLNSTYGASNPWVRCRELRGNISLLPSPSDLGISNLCAGKWVTSESGYDTYLVISLGGDAVLPSSGSISAYYNNNPAIVLPVTIISLDADPSGLALSDQEYGIIYQLSESEARDAKTGTYTMPAWVILLVTIGCITAIHIITVGLWLYCCGTKTSTSTRGVHVSKTFRTCSSSRVIGLPEEEYPATGHSPPFKPTAGSVFDVSVLPQHARPRSMLEPNGRLNVTRSACYDYDTNNPIDDLGSWGTTKTTSKQQAYRFRDRTTPRVLQRSDFGHQAPFGTYDEYLKAENFYDNLSTNVIDEAAGPYGEMTYHPRVQLVDPDREISTQRIVAEETVVRYR